MSRAKAKLVLMRDLQCKQPDWVLTKKDCDMIAKALLETYGMKDRKLLQFYIYLKDLGRITQTKAELNAHRTFPDYTYLGQTISHKKRQPMLSVEPRAARQSTHGEYQHRPPIYGRAILLGNRWRLEEKDKPVKKSCENICVISRKSITLQMLKIFFTYS